MNSRLMSRQVLAYMTVILSATVAVGGNERFDASDAPQQVAATLKGIAAGYGAHQEQVRELRVRGHITVLQWGADVGGLDVEEREREFLLEVAHGKRRFEMDVSEKETDGRWYTLDNNERIINYSVNALRIAPVDDQEEAVWNNWTGHYSRFEVTFPSAGYENVGNAMNTCLRKLEDGEYGPESNKTLAVTVAESGLITVLETWPSGTLETVVDSKRGFNLIESTFTFDSPKLKIERRVRNEYEQGNNGEWILMKARRFGSNDGVRYEHTLEVSEFEAGELGIPDERFEMSSLEIPADTYIIDWHFSPPLEWNRGGQRDSAPTGKR